MAGRKALAITERQFAVLRVLWKQGPMTVRELMEHLPGGDRQPYTTVLGLLQTMQKAGLVEARKEGLTHRFLPSISRQEATGNLLADFMNRFFHGSAEQLILGLVDARQVAPDELSAIEARLAARAGAETSLEEPAKLPKSSSRGRKKPSSRQRLITLGALFLTASLGAASLRVATAEPQPEQQPRNVPAARIQTDGRSAGGANGPWRRTRSRGQADRRCHRGRGTLRDRQGQPSGPENRQRRPLLLARATRLVHICCLCIQGRLGDLVNHGMDRR